MLFPLPLYHHGPHITPWSLESIGYQLGAAGEQIQSSASSTWAASNRAILVPFWLTSPFPIRNIFWLNGTAVSGNVDAAVYGLNGNRILSTGSTAQAGTSSMQVVSTTETWLGPGKFFLGLVLDNTTGTIVRGNPGGPRTKAYGILMNNSSFPFPADISSTWQESITATVPLVGISERSFI